MSNADDAERRVGHIGVDKRPRHRRPAHRQHSAGSGDCAWVDMDAVKHGYVSHTPSPPWRGNVAMPPPAPEAYAYMPTSAQQRPVIVPVSPGQGGLSPTFFPPRSGPSSASRVPHLLMGEEDHLQAVPVRRQKGRSKTPGARNRSPPLRSPILRTALRAGSGDIINELQAR